MAEGAEVSMSSGSGGRRPRSGTSLRRLADTSGERLISRIAAGDSEAVGLIFDRYGRPAYSLARRICGDDKIAAQVVQESLLALWCDPQSYEPLRGSFEGWLITLVHHKAVDAVRRESSGRTRPALGANGVEQRNAPDSEAARDTLGAGLAGRVHVALDELPDGQREALTLAYYGGYTQQEIAAITGAHLDTVKSRMFAGVQRLRQVLLTLQPDIAEMFGADR